MSIKSNRQKGKDLENYVAEKLRLSGVDIHAKRQIGSGQGKFKGDISTSLAWTFECKNTAKLKFQETAEQVARESMGYQKEVIVWHPPQNPLADSVVMITLDDFIDLLAKEKTAGGVDNLLDKREVKWHLEKVAFHAKQVIRELGQ